MLAVTNETTRTLTRGRLMGEWTKARIQLCGRFVADIDGARVEDALEGAHRAESCIAQGRWADAWGPAGVAYHVATRRFLTGLEASWIDQWRRRLEEVRLRGLECFAAAGLGLGGPALAQAEERARMLTELAPYRETGHRLLVEALARRGNVAEALRAYERLRVLLREELGIAPSPTVQGVHRRLLESAGS